MKTDDITAGNGHGRPRGRAFWHLMAFITVAIWGTTFVWTKLLIHSGLTPAQIFFLRFTVAYLLLLGFSLAVKGRGHRWLARSRADELIMLGLGVTGGSLYFLTENESLRLTAATNTSLIVCSCPMFAMLIIAVCYKSRIGRTRAAGSVCALVGMVAVVLNGRFVLHLSPLGDALAFAACLCWAVYSLLMVRVAGRYSAMFITRKVFFYGLVTILPWFLIAGAFSPDGWAAGSPVPPFELLLRPQVLANLLFLGCIASMVCFLVWSRCMRQLGAVECTNWVYVNPLATIVFAHFILGEQITVYFIFGSAMILLGLYLSDKKKTPASGKANKTKKPGSGKANA